MTKILYILRRVKAGDGKRRIAKATGAPYWGQIFTVDKQVSSRHTRPMARPLESD